MARYARKNTHLAENLKEIKHLKCVSWCQITDYQTKLKLLTNQYLVADIVRHMAVYIAG